MKPSNVDVPVLILFFNRPQTLEKVFEAVKQARPSVLLLAQDGPRAGRNELSKIQECRNIVDQIDWDCKVYKNYAEENMSCDQREFTAIRWAFTIVDKLIILEDDCVPCASFFPFCKELLDRYEFDDRVDRISGYNRLEKYEDVKADYLFSTIAAGYGWATWKRNWNRIEKLVSYEFLDDEDFSNIYNKSRKIIADKNYGDILSQCSNYRKKNEKTGIINSWENLVGVNSLINNSLIITPKNNMVCNIGATGDATHYTELKYSNAIVRRLLSMKSYEVEFPIKHPLFVMRDANFEKLHYKKIHAGPFRKFALKFDVGLRYVFSGNFKPVIKSIKRRLKLDKNE